jgi:pimeloyl-ACP methyl ester carboxylesterase
VIEALTRHAAGTFIRLAGVGRRLTAFQSGDQTASVRIRKLLVTAAGVLSLSVLAPTLSGSAPGAGAATPATDTSGIVYPLTSFLDWAQNPLSNFTNPTLGAYAFGQELAAAQASIQGLPAQLDPSVLLGPNGPSNAVAISEEMASALIHLRPRVAGDDVTDMANPNFLPDYDHNGVSGDPGDFVAMSTGAASTGYFLYPCLADSGAVTYETTGGTCAAAGTAGDTFKQGLAQRTQIVNARGLTLSATVWFPAIALKPGCPSVSPNPSGCTAPGGLAPRASLNGGRGLPTVVISDGLASAQDSYFWLAMSLARAGDIVVTYDPAGQGQSEGSVVNLFTPSVADCEFGGACRDLQDVLRWVVGQPITPVVNLATATPLGFSGPTMSPNPAIHNPAYAPAGANQVDPARGAIDPSKLAVVGHSMGALSLLNLLWFQGHGGTGADGKPLPPLAAGVALSGAGPTTATVPVQFQTSDFDGSPTLIGPAVGGVDLGTGGNGIGYADMKPLYDQLRTQGPGQSALSLIVLEGGLHTDFIDTPFITRTNWSLAVSAHYAQDWLGCYLDANRADCASASTAVPHLSSSFASEAAATGPPPRQSGCITVPTTASLGDAPGSFLPAIAGHPVFNCVRPG